MDTNPMSPEEYLRNIYTALEKLQNSVDRIEAELASVTIRLISVENVLAKMDTQRFP
jgi:hypothetical protein